MMFIFHFVINCVPLFLVSFMVIYFLNAPSSFIFFEVVNSFFLFSKTNFNSSTYIFPQIDYLVSQCLPRQNWRNIPNKMTCLTGKESLFSIHFKNLKCRLIRMHILRSEFIIKTIFPRELGFDCIWLDQLAYADAKINVHLFIAKLSSWC